MESTRARSGWLNLAVALAGIVGVYNVASGIGAIAENDVTENAAKVLYDVDLTAWGWVWLILGVIQLVTAVLIYQRNAFGLWMGILWASISAALTVFVIFVFPLWAILVLVLDLGILFACFDALTDYE